MPEDHGTMREWVIEQMNEIITQAIERLEPFHAISSSEQVMLHKEVDELKNKLGDLFNIIPAK